MIGTHSAKLFNSKLKQSSLNAEIIAPVPKYYICSSTVNLRQKFWALPLSAADMPMYREMVDFERESQPRRIPDIEDPRLVKQLLIPFKDSYIALSPVPSCGLLHEISQRSFEDKIYPIYRRTIQPVVAAWTNHGEMLLNQKGKLALLMKGLAKSNKEARSNTRYITIKCRIEKMNVSSGMAAVLFPSITAIGGAIHKIERVVNRKLDFAIGFKNLSYTMAGVVSQTVRAKKVVPQLILDEMTGNAELIILLRTQKDTTEEENQKILEYLQKNPLHRIAGGTTWEYYVGYEKYNDSYTFMLDMSSEITGEINEDNDVLDVTFEKYKNKGEINKKTGIFEIKEVTDVIINHTGYALLEEPKQRENTRGGYPHAWCEPIFSVIKQEKFSNEAFWTRKEEKFGVIWKNR